MDAKDRYLATLKDIREAADALAVARDAMTDGRLPDAIDQMSFVRHLMLAAITRTRNEQERAQW